MAETASGILERMMARIPSKYNRDVGGYIHDVLAPAAIEFEKAYAKIDVNMKKLRVATAEGTDLDAALEEFGYTRKKATYAAGYVTVKGEVDAVIYEGDLVSKGKTVYTVKETATLTDGTATVAVQAQLPGSDGNADAGEINYFPVTLNNIYSVTNAEKITGGTDSETDEEYRERYYYFLDHPVTSGNVYEYEMWAREVDGVGLAKCYRIWNGPGTVKVVITSATLEPADDTLVQKVFDYIEEKRVVGPTLTVVSAEKVEIFVTVSVVIKSGYSADTICGQYETELENYFKELGFEGGSAPYTKFGSILQEIEGVDYYLPETLLVNGAIQNIEIGEGQLAVLGGVEFGG